ncbi:unnamed protein product [Trichobilharzia szidati]|nr:unnamed protein product [Trichobilharzia szidati]
MDMEITESTSIENNEEKSKPTDSQIYTDSPESRSESSVDSSQIIDHLIQMGVKVNKKDKTGRTALHYTALRGNTEATLQLIENNANAELLVDAGADGTEVNSLEGAPLHEASIYGHLNGVVEALLNSPFWNDILQKVTISKYGYMETPIRRMIRLMPGAAALVFNKCVIRNGIPQTHTKHTITFNYEFLEDENQSWVVNTLKLIENNTCKRQEENSFTRLVPRKKKKVNTMGHPLDLMVSTTTVI